VDTNVAALLAVGLLALVAIGFFVVFRRRGRIEVHGPFGTKLKAEGSNEPAAPAPAVRGKDIVSEAGNVTAQDKTGRGVETEKVRAKQDVRLSSEPPPGERPPKS